MRSLFPRIFLSFWIAMTLIGAAFAIIYATTFPSARMERRRAFMDEALALEAEHALASPSPRDELARFERETDIALYVEDVGPAPREVRALMDRTRRDGPHRERTADDAELVSFRLSGDRVAVAHIERPSRWLIWIGGDTLVQRLLVVFLISGVVSLLLARYLTRPLRTLRAATQRLAGGDLAARVGPELGSTDREIAALGRDFDRMAERVEGLVVAQQRLLSDVSHELNSPLARLRVALELARTKGGTAPLDRIEREAERLGVLVGEILTLGRLEPGSPHDKRAIDLRALATSIVEDADFEAQGSERRVILAEADDVAFEGDPEILRRAIENVLRNAVRFTPAGTEVTVRLTREASDIVVSVRDRGPGVPEHALRDIFVPLYRVESDRDRRTGGAGLGLAIAERAVKLHGGSVSAKNADGGGLLVTMRLPG
jgi:two-component system OmpR family sensor kinase